MYLWETKAQEFIISHISGNSFNLTIRSQT